jgi:hypothetical protein
MFPLEGALEVFDLNNILSFKKTIFLVIINKYINKNITSDKSVNKTKLS